jgi:hypothetical protein
MGCHDVRGPKRRFAQVDGLEPYGIDMRIQREIFGRGLNRIRIVVDPERFARAKQAGGQSQHARAGSDVQHDAILEVNPLKGCETQPRRGVMSRPETH